MFVGFCNGKCLKEYLIRAALVKTNESRRSEPCGKNQVSFCMDLVKILLESWEEAVKIKNLYSILQDTFFKDV